MIYFCPSLFNSIRAFLFPILICNLNFDMMQRGTQTLALTLVGVLTTRHHSKESRPEIQKSAGGRRGTRHGGDLLFPRLLLSRSDVTISLWGTWSSDDKWHALRNQEYEQGTLDKKGHLGDWYVPNVSIISACSMHVLCDFAMFCLKFHTLLNLFGLIY